MLRMEHRNDFATMVANRVGDLIGASGVTRTWICEQTGIPRVTLHRRLSGLSPFTLAELDRIADALRVPTTSLLPATDREDVSA